MTEKPIYTALAPLYDALMGDVDYDAWADYIDEIIQIYAPRTERLLELACGTGSMSFSLEELGYYRVTGTDLSPEMIAVARQKAKLTDSEVLFRVMSLLDIDLEEQFDAAFCVFDSINYLQEPQLILDFLHQAEKIIRPGGLLIFDFTTPKNSIESVDYLNNEELTSGNFRFFRTSRYDNAQKIHTNEFEIHELDEDGSTILNTFKESHHQRIYSLEEILAILRQTSYHLLAKYGDFDFIEADEESSRVTIVLRCQKT